MQIFLLLLKEKKKKNPLHFPIFSGKQLLPVYRYYYDKVCPLLLSLVSRYVYHLTQT